MKTPILGSSYVARSVNAADSRMVNLFPEIVPESGKEPAFLNRAPGLTLLTTIGTGPIRGMWQMGADLYIVSGATLYRMDTNYALTIIGTVANDGTPVSMADSRATLDDVRILFVACNGPTYVYFLYPDGESVFTQIQIDTWPGAITVGYLDGYFIFSAPNSESIYILDAQSVDTFSLLDVKRAEGANDDIVGMIINHKEIWIFGANSTEVWYDNGGAQYPFGPIQGAFNEIGCCATNSIAKMDNSVFWLGCDARGQGIVYRAKGYIGERISTHAVEWQIQQYGDLSNAVAYTYQQDGHSFYVLVFPSQNTTWVYDAATQAWHERCGFSAGAFTRHQGNCQAFFNNLVMIGDYANGNLYKFDLNSFTDNGATQRWLRSWRALAPDADNLNRAAHHSLQLDCESGVGLNTGQGIDPQVMLRWSDDGGHTWSDEHWASMGAIGTYGTRVIWRRLGMTLKIRDRVYEVSGTDPVKVVIMGAELHASNTNA